MDDAKEFSLGKGRLEAFSDGVFAIAITLLVLEIPLPVPQGLPTSLEQVQALLAIWPQYAVYFVSFATIGIMWLNHHALFQNVRRVTHGVVLANLLLLSLISFLPFPTEVFGRYGLTNIAVAYYGLTMTLISIAYNVVFAQVVAAHPGCSNRMTLWTIIGLTLYPLVSIAGYFFPAAGLLGLAGLAAFYMQAKKVHSVVLQIPETKSA